MLDGGGGYGLTCDTVLKAFVVIRYCDQTISFHNYILERKILGWIEVMKNGKRKLSIGFCNSNITNTQIVVFKLTPATQMTTNRDLWFTSTLITWSWPFIMRGLLHKVLQQEPKARAGFEPAESRSMVGLTFTYSLWLLAATPATLIRDQVKF